MSWVLPLWIRYAVSQGCIATLCACIKDRHDLLSAPIIAILQALQSLITDFCEPDAEYHMSLVEECGGQFMLCIYCTFTFHLILVVVEYSSTVGTISSLANSAFNLKTCGHVLETNSSAQAGYSPQ